jgi:hypothetical protein
MTPPQRGHLGSVRVSTLTPANTSIDDAGPLAVPIGHSTTEVDGLCLHDAALLSPVNGDQHTLPIVRGATDRAGGLLREVLEGAWSWPNTAAHADASARFLRLRRGLSVAHLRGCGGSQNMSLLNCSRVIWPRVARSIAMAAFAETLFLRNQFATDGCLTPHR